MKRSKYDRKRKERREERVERTFLADMPDDPAKDTEAVMRFYKIPKSFPREVRDEVKSLEHFTSPKRLDLRKKFIFTCDPMTARDYDDALSLEHDRLRRRVLGVHIADVSHFVRPGSAIDREAYRRSTSIYFADRVVPMLPEELSNGLCSLVPGEDRLTFSVFITFNSEGDVVKTSFAKSIINSKARFTYEEVMATISSRKVVNPKIKRAQAKTIKEIHELAQQLRAKRFRLGALDLEIPEMEVQLDQSGSMLGLVAAPYDESHQMIEECMVAANEAVAKELWTHNVKILARNHASPDPERLYELRHDLNHMGVKCGNLENAKVFAQLLQTVKSHPLYPTIAVMILRSMKRACYSASDMGHWGLAKRYYSHFTSPIRRYPDLTLHRQLAAYLAGDNPRVSPDTLKRWADHTTAQEEMATEAERTLLEMKKYRLLEDELAARTCVVYEGVISRCENFGCFVDVPSIGVSGLIHISALSRKFVRYNQSDRSLSAPGGGSWHVGDRIKVTVVRVDFPERKIDFAVAH